MATEKRLIDVNKVIDAMQKCIDKAPVGEYPIATYAFRSIIECLKQEPTVDAVEVPCRCKECKYWKHYDHLGCTEFVRVCTFAYYMIDENGYCLYGAKMDGGNEDG